MYIRIYIHIYVYFNTFAHTYICVPIYIYTYIYHLKIFIASRLFGVMPLLIVRYRGKCLHYQHLNNTFEIVSRSYTYASYKYIYIYIYVDRIYLDI